MLFNKKRKKIDFLSATTEKIGDLIPFTGKKKKNFFWRIMKYFFGFLAILFALAIILTAVLFFKFKNIYELAVSGKSSLEYSIESAKKKDFTAMFSNSQEAEKYFSDIGKEFQTLENNLFVKNFDFAKNLPGKKREY